MTEARRKDDDLFIWSPGVSNEIVEQGSLSREIASRMH